MSQPSIPDATNRTGDPSRSTDQYVPRTSRATETCLRITDLALVGIVVVAPLFMGGRHPMGRLVFVAFAVLAATAWLLRQCCQANARWRSSPASWILLGGLAVLAFQLAPLPPHLHAQVAPHAGEHLTLWNAEADAAVRLGTWTQVTLSPVATRGGLVMFLAYGLLFLTVVQRVEQLRDIERLLKWIAIGAIGMALLGIVQYLATNGKFLWIYEHPFRTANQVQGSFINRNHFAHLLVLGIGPIGYWLLTKASQTAERSRGTFQSRRGQAGSADLAQMGLAVGLALVLFAILMSLSRAGALAMMAAILVAGIGFYLARLLNRKRLLVGVALTAFVGSLLLVYGYDQVAGRLDDFSTLSIDDLDRSGGRRRLWEANWTAFTQNVVAGHGVGSHRNFYPMYLPESRAVEFTHAESGPVQIASETGLAGLGLLVVGILLCVTWCVRPFFRTTSSRVRGCAGAIGAGIAASLLHSMVDFVWYIPATMSWTVILAALALRIDQGTATRRSDERRPSPEACPMIPRIAWIGMTATVIVMGAWMVVERSHSALASRHWDHYLQRSRQLAALEKTGPADAPTAASETRESPVSSDDRGIPSILDAMRSHLEDTLRSDPEYGRAHLRLAAVYLRAFQQQQKHSENQMDLAQIRDAAIASKFPSRDALNQWLDRAVGPHRVYLDRALWHARRGLRLCPVQGEGYLYLAELCFLEGGGAGATRSYVDQALRVRPYDGNVLFLAGKESLLSGDVPTAVAHWKRAYKSSPRQRVQLVRLLANRVPVSFLLEHFKPKLSDWVSFSMQYRQVGRSDDIRSLCRYFAALVQAEPADSSPAETARLWLAIHRFYRQLGDAVAATASLDAALASQCDKYSTRREIAIALAATGRLAEAKLEIRWCLQRKPSDPALRNVLERTVKARIAGKPAPTTGVPH